MVAPSSCQAFAPSPRAHIARERTLPASAHCPRAHIAGERTLPAATRPPPRGASPSLSRTHLARLRRPARGRSADRARHAGLARALLPAAAALALCLVRPRQLHAPRTHLPLPAPPGPVRPTRQSARPADTPPLAAASREPAGSAGQSAISYDGHHRALVPADHRRWLSPGRRQRRQMSVTRARLRARTGPIRAG